MRWQALHVGRVPHAMAAGPVSRARLAQWVLTAGMRIHRHTARWLAVALLVAAACGAPEDDIGPADPDGVRQREAYDDRAMGGERVEPRTGGQPTDEADRPPAGTPDH